MSSPVLVTVILNWNNAGLAISCAKSVLQAYDCANAAAGDLHIMLVDNGSNTLDVQRLQDWCQQAHRFGVSLVQNTDNLGFAAGMNTAIRNILQQNPAYLWLLNNDTEVAADSVSHLLEFAAQNDRASIIGVTMVDSSGERVLSAGGYRYFPWLGYSRPLGAGLSPADVSCGMQAPGQGRADYVDGAAMWLRTDLLRRSDGLPERHFLYFEELEVNELLSPGEEIGWCREARVMHLSGASSAGRDVAGASYHAALSAFRYTLRVHPLLLPTVIAARVLGVALLAARRLQPAMFTAVLRALWTFVRTGSGHPRPYGD